MLTGEMEWCPARRQSRETLTSLEQLADRGGGGKEMLDIVEEQEEFTFTQRGLNLVQQRPVAGLLDRKRAGDRPEHEFGVGDRGKRHERRTVPEGGRRDLRDSQSEPRLADAAGSDQSQEANVVASHQREHRRNVAIPPHERGERLWELASAMRIAPYRAVEGERRRLGLVGWE